MSLLKQAKSEGEILFIEHERGDTFRGVCGWSGRFGCLFFGFLILGVCEFGRAFVLLWRALLDWEKRSLHLYVLLSSAFVVDLAVALFADVLLAVFAKQRGCS